MKYLRSTKPVSIKALTDTFRYAKQPWTFNSRFDAEIILIVRLHYSKFQLPSQIEGLNIRRLAINGEIDLSRSPFLDFSQILESTRDCTSDFCVVAKVGFNESASCQNKTYHDSISIHAIRNSYHISYRANGSVLTDVAYRHKFMRRLERESGLPIRLIDTGRSYELKHSDGGQLKILDSEWHGKNPTAFSCEIHGGTIGSVIALLERFLDIFGSSKYFRQHWEIYTCDQQQNDARADNLNAKRRLLRKLSSHPELFPASRYKLNFDCSIQDERPLEELRSLWKPKDRIYAALAAFESSDLGQLSFHVITHDVGHWLWFESRGPIDRQALESDLGVTLEEVKEGWAIWEKY